MEELYNIGISEVTLKIMMEINSRLLDLTNNEVIEKKLLLEEVGCSEIQILNIISSNPLFLNRITSEIVKLLECLRNFGLKSLNILFDSNPYILNLEPFEINNYINNRINNGELPENIIDDLDSNPYLFSEI